MSKKVLVFPCGSEIGLEIYRSMCYSSHFDLIGASSVDDHGRFVYEKYIGNVPFHTDPQFIDIILNIIKEHSIDCIYPTMDAVAETIKKNAEKLNTIIIGSSTEATSICASKKRTYNSLRKFIAVPEIYTDLDNATFPLFIKPDRGYGARNTLIAYDAETARSFISQFEQNSMLLVEYLPRQEWTIDCFSDRHGNLKFHAARLRARVNNGISVNTKPCNQNAIEFSHWAEEINKVLHPRGAWFFQAKLDKNGKPKLLEVAVRLGGSSGIFRCQGINFALLSAFDAFELDVTIEHNKYHIEMDRALNNKYKIDLHYDHIFVDLDDCLIIKGKLHLDLLKFLYQAITLGKTLTLITRHFQDPHITLRKYRLSSIFDRIIHITNDAEMKSDYINNTRSIFIDDSYKERKNVTNNCGIPVFSPDMIEALI